MVNALTNRYGRIANVLLSEVEIENPINGEKIKTNAIWDTGATNCCITQNVATAIKCPEITKAIVNGVHGEQEVPVYFVKITLNNKSISLNVKVTQCSELSKDGGIGMLIGMDIITLGDFSVSNHNGETFMTFRKPSIETTDYVEEINLANKYQKIYLVKKRKGIEKCPCGSNKLFKNCHGKYFQ